MRGAIDINCDIGEGFGLYKLGDDEELVKYITSANIACGFHAGDPDWMQETVRLAEEHGVAIGAHPGFADLKGFGRRDMALSPQEVRNALVYQIGALTAFTRGKTLQHVKPHGAMYNMATGGGELAKAICQAILDVNAELILVALSGTNWVDVAKDMGIRVAQEAFMDRALNPDGTLVPRSNPVSMIYDVEEVVRRGVKIVTEGRATTITGEEVDVYADTLCIHGDNPGSVGIVTGLRTELEVIGVKILPVGDLV